MTSRACASPSPVSGFLDLMDLKPDVELNSLEYLLVASAHGVAADQGGRVLRHEYRLGAV